MSWTDKLLRRNKETEQIVDPKRVEIPVKIGIINSTHQIMAITVSEIARLYPKEFDMIKHILTEYAFFIESILAFRETGNPEDFFKKLQEFLIRSVKGYLECYEETNEVVPEEKPVIKVILNGIASIQEKVEENEGIQDKQDEEVKSTRIGKPVEDWDSKPKIKISSGVPIMEADSLDPEASITSIKGIGEARAKKLRTAGIKTVKDYLEYKKVQEEKQKEIDLADEEEDKNE